MIFIFDSRSFYMNKKTCKPYTVVGPTRENVVPYPLAILSLDNLLSIKCIKISLCSETMKT